MSIDVAFAVPETDFRLGRLLGRAPVRAVRLLDFVPVERPYLWVESTDFDDVAATVESDDAVAGVESLASADGRRLYAIDWREDAENFLRDCSRYGLSIERAEMGDRWRFRALAPDRGALRRVQSACTTADVDLSFRTLRDPRPPGSDDDGLTRPQREALKLASEAGYFECPREATLSDLSAELGITTQAVSDRLRRGLSTLVADEPGGARPATGRAHSKP